MTVLNPIKRLPTESHDVQATVVAMTAELIALWKANVQPLVDGNYAHDKDARRAGHQRIRADVGWDWHDIYQLSAWHNLMTKFPGVKSGPALALSIVVHPDGARGAFPVGMLTVVPRLNCNAFGQARHRGFAWYLADAPREAYTDVLRCQVVKGVASALVDCSIQAARDASADGTHLLHADPNGGINLTDFYVNRCKMTQLAPNTGPVTPIFRRSRSEEYYHLSDAQSAAYCAKWDARR